MAIEQHLRTTKRDLVIGFSSIFVVLLLVVAIVILVPYLTRPQIAYSVKTADCSTAAIKTRNKKVGYESEACVIVISAKNLQDRSVDVGYMNTGGGPLGGGDPLIRIYSGNDKFCYSGGIDIASLDFAPHQTIEMTLQCNYGGTLNGQDTSSDLNPTSVVISGYSGGTIELRPIR